MNQLNNIQYLDIRNLNEKEKSKLITTYDNNNNAVSFYSDNVWDLSFKARTHSNIQKKLIFDNKIFHDGKKIIDNSFYIKIYKDAIYHSLSKGIKIGTLSYYTQHFFHFLNYCYTSFENKPINKLTIEEINSFIDYLKLQKKDLKDKGKILSTVKSIIFQPNLNSSFSINFEPFEDITIKKLRNQKNTTQTKVIPDKEWSIIINHCSNVIEDYYSNIEIEDKLLEVLDDALKNNAHHRFNLFFKKKLKSSIPQYKNLTKYYQYIGDLQISAAIIIQAFTGMRISELYSLQKGCITTENINFENKNHIIHKINGLTFKYQNVVKNELEGKQTSWLCPVIVSKAVEVLELSTRLARMKIDYKIKELKSKKLDTSYLEENKFSLFLSNSMPTKKTHKNKYIVQIVDYSQSSYNKYILKNNIKLDFKLHSHCFRRTLARFLSRSLIDIEIEAIKEQFKHFSKDITFYYMREDNKLENNFAELIEEYENTTNNKKKSLTFEKMKKSLDNAILSVNNFEDLSLLTNGRQLKVVNEFAASINNENTIFSPIDCLSCEGNVIIPNIHIKYWQEMLETYNEMIDIEPNSIWYKKERDMVLKVIKTLKENKVYITGAKQ